MDNKAYALKMQGITKRFPGTLANDHITIECEHGKVLGLLGENGAGKTTLMNILYGLFRPDEGQIFIDGEEVEIQSPSDAIDHGIGMVHQHFKLVDTLTVIENVVLGLPTMKQVLDLAPAKEKLLKLCHEYELFVDPDAEVWRLPVGQQQWVEILKALYRDCKVLVLDEPTAVLTPSESDNLCRAIGKITAQGKSVIFISHKLREVMEITDNVTVLRDGKVIGTIATKDATQLKLAEMMVGRAVEIERRPRAKVPADSEPVLVMKDVNVYDERGVHALKNFNLTVHAGEIVGVAGIDGNGQRELAECISGLIKPQSGTIEIKGKPVTGVISDPSFLGFIPEDRHKTGLVLDFTVAENLIIKEYMKAPFAKKGILCESAKCEGDRCLTCNVVCQVCADVCPNRANVSIALPDGRRQILHVDRMCNECGNCAAFCPYDSSPYRDKFTLFFDREGFDESTGNSGFLPLGGKKVLVRLEGKVFEADLSGKNDLPADIEVLIYTVLTKYNYLIG